MCLSWAFVKCCVCPSFSFGIEGRMWDVTVLIPNDCLLFRFTGLMCLKFGMQHDLVIPYHVCSNVVPCPTLRGPGLEL